MSEYLYKSVAVNYLNTKPLLWGMIQKGLDRQVEMKLEIPSICADFLQNGQADFGLVPVASIPFIENATIITDFCIGTNGTVKTVCLLSEVSIEEIEVIYLDFHSRTSCQLIQILIKEYWKKEVKFIQSEKGFEQNIKGKTAGLVIGDRVFNLLDQVKYVYDLGEIWKEMTGLPFVFAAWVTRKNLDDSFIKQLNEAFELGVSSIPSLALVMPQEYSEINLTKYYKENISYELNEEKIISLKLFFEKLSFPAPIFQKELELS